MRDGAVVCSKISLPVELVVGELLGLLLIHAEILVGVCCGDKRLLLHVVGDPTDAWEVGPWRRGSIALFDWMLKAERDRAGMTRERGDRLK